MASRDSALIQEATQVIYRASKRIDALEAKNALLTAENTRLAALAAEQDAKIKKLEAKAIDASWALNPERMGR